MFQNNSLINKLHEKPTHLDAILLSVFAFFMTWNPYYLHGELNIYELGLYLPGINAIFHGDIPYRDFFYLRGPFELYVPTMFMTIFGKQVAVLQTYFYLGTITTLVLSIFIAREIIKTRYILYLFTLVFVARTFPRVVFTFWGGMRYALGLGVIYLVIQFLKRDSVRFMFWAGVVCALSLLTSIDVGLASILSVVGTLIYTWSFTYKNKTILREGIKKFFFGTLIVIVPYVIYLIFVQAFLPFLESVWAVITRLGMVVNAHVLSDSPQNFFEVLGAMLNPASKNFRHMTPMYLYIILGVYLFRRIKKQKTKGIDAMIVCVGIYGLLLFLMNFRGFGGAQFEMALQPEKILLFFVLGNVYFMLLGMKEKFSENLDQTHAFSKLCGIMFLLLAFFMSSVCFSIMRYNRRFFMPKYISSIFTGKNVEHLQPIKNSEGRFLDLERAKGIFVPNAQADEIEAVTYILELQTEKDQPVLMYPEGAIYHFLADRPHVGRFPICTLSWLQDDWHDEFKEQILSERVKYVVLQQQLEKNKYEIFFSYAPNKIKYHEIMGIIKNQYVLKHQTLESNILKLRE